MNNFLLWSSESWVSYYSSGLTGRSPRLITAPAAAVAAPVALPPPAGDAYYAAGHNAVPATAYIPQEAQPAYQPGPETPPQFPENPPQYSEPTIDFESCNCKFGKLGKKNSDHTFVKDFV